MKNDPSHNKYYFLPLILGLIGAYWHFKRNQKDAGVVGLLFFFTGLAIVLYLNQNPLQPRERDYAYAGSFYAFAIWIGLGVAAIQEFLSKKLDPKMASIGATVLGLLVAPVIMAKDGWDDHNRSQKYVARDLARNYLESCAPNAILFTYGDNDTYPLWYVQEVEGVRKDVRVVNLSLLSADWYVRQMTKKVNDADALPIRIPEEKYVRGVRDVIYYQDAKIPGYVDLDRIVALMLSDNPKDKLPLQGGDYENFLPTKKLQLTIDKEAVRSHGVVPEKWSEYIVDTLQFTYNKSYVTRAELAIMDILVNNNWERPIYFATTVPADNYMGLDNYLVSQGFALRLMPVRIPGGEDRDMPVHTDALVDQIKNKYTWGNLAGSPYLDPESYRMISMVLNNVYSATATALIAEGRDAEAKEVLFDALENMPQRIFRIMDSFAYTYIVDNLYQVGEIEKANALIERNVNYLDQQLNYFAKIAETKPNHEIQNIQYALYTLGRFSDSANEYGVSEIHDRVEQLINQYQQRFLR
jgi:hypothetical protein